MGEAATTAGDAPKERALRAIDRGGTVDLLRRAVAAPSVTGQEAAVAALLQEELTALDLDAVDLTDFAPGRPNVRASWGDRDGPTLMFAGHTDTVEPFD